MIDSRQMEDLREPFRTAAISFIKEYQTRNKIRLLVTSTLRDQEEQTHLFAIGRTLPGKIVTNARAGESFHNFGLAFDAYPLIGGKPLWNVFDDQHVMVIAWRKYGELGKEFGFNWAGSWLNFKEYAHMQFSGYTLAQLQAQTTAITRS